MSETNIDVVKIMSEIDAEVQKKMNNPEYAKDIERLKKLSVDKQISSTTSDLYSLTFLSRRMVVPQSTRSGFFSKILNIFIVKFYYVVSKMLEPVFNTQEKFNRAMLEEITELKRNSIGQAALSFPYAKFSDKILSNSGNDYSVYKSIVENKKRILDLSAWKPAFLEFAQSCGANELFGVDIGTTEINDGNLQIRNSDPIEFMDSRSENEFDVITIFNRLGYYNMDYMTSLLTQAKRTLKQGGYLIIEDYILSKFIQKNDIRVFNPIAEDTVKFLLEYLGFFNIEKVNIKDENKYAITAQKA